MISNWVPALSITHLALLSWALSTSLSSCSRARPSSPPHCSFAILWAWRSSTWLMSICSWLVALPRPLSLHGEVMLCEVELKSRSTTEVPEQSRDFTEQPSFAFHFTNLSSKVVHIYFGFPHAFYILCAKEPCQVLWAYCFLMFTANCVSKPTLLVMLMINRLIKPLRISLIKNVFVNNKNTNTSKKDDRYLFFKYPVSLIDSQAVDYRLRISFNILTPKH